VTAQQVQELLAHGATIDPELSARFLFEPYRLPGDAFVLVDLDGSGILYESRAELLAAIDKLSTDRWTHVLAARLPQGRAFVTDVARLAAEFVEQSDGRLDGSEQGLAAIDDLVRARGAETFLEPDQYPACSPTSER
jgi:hypothetical protein